VVRHKGLWRLVCHRIMASGVWALGQGQGGWWRSGGPGTSWLLPAGQAAAGVSLDLLIRQQQPTALLSTSALEQQAMTEAVPCPSDV
jgi:hypothetical protein